MPVGWGVADLRGWPLEFTLAYAPNPSLMVKHLDKEPGLVIIRNVLDWSCFVTTHIG